MKLSFMIVTYDSTENVIEILEQMETFVDELVVVHDGKEVDNVLTVAREYGAKTLEAMPHMGYADPHRQTARELCTGDWILWSDTDECWVTDGKYIRDAINNADMNGYEAIYVLRDNIYRGLLESHPRIFKNSSSFRFNDIIHLTFDSVPRAIHDNNIVLKHYDKHDEVDENGYYVNLDYRRDKMLRYKNAQDYVREKYKDRPDILSFPGLNYNYDDILAEVRRK